MNAFASVMHTATNMAHTAYSAAVNTFRERTMRPAEMDTLIHGKFFPLVPPVLDESRLFHRLLRYWIYYMRHVDPSFIDPQLRRFVDVQSDDEGELTDGGSWRQR